MKYQYKIFIFMLLGVLLISFACATTENTIIPCGGDNNVIINCLDSADLTFLSSLPTTSPGSSGGGPSMNVSENVTIPPQQQPSFDFTLLIFIGLIIILIWFIYLIYCRKKKKDKDSICYKEKKK